MNRRHAAVAATAVVSFAAAGGLAYALGVNGSTKGSSTPTGELPAAAAAAGTSTPSWQAGQDTNPAQVPGVVGYLNTGGQTVAYLTWQVDASGTVSGTLDAASVSGTAPDEVVVPNTNISVFGQINGTTISLQVNGHTDTGTLSDGTLVLNVVQHDGTIAPITFRSATPADYNAALASLRSTVASDDGQAQQAINTEAAITQLAKDYQALGGAQNSLVSDVAQLQTNLGTASSDLSGEQTAEGNVLTEVGNGTDPNTVCSDADTVASDADTVQSDADTFSSTLSSVTNDLTNLRNALPQVQADLAAVQADDPTYAGSGNAPSPEDVNAEMSSASSVAGQQVTLANSRIDNINGDVATAQSYAVKAAQAGSCSGPSSAPSPISHIS